MNGSVTALFWFTVRQTLLQRKIWPTLLLLASPCGLILIVRHFEHDPQIWARFHGPALFIIVTLAIPLVCILYGTALIGSEVEGQTLVYLLTRRMRRATVLITRFAATGVVLTLLFQLATIVVFTFALGGVDTEGMAPGVRHHLPAGNWDPLRDLGWYLVIMPLGIAAFLALFTLVSMVTSRPLGASIGYFVLVELIAGNIPVRVQNYTISHQIRATMFENIPRLIDLYDLPRSLLEQIYPPGSTGTIALIAVAVSALALSCVFVTIRELVPAKLARE